MKEDDEREATENGVCLGHLGALLKVDEDGVFAELKIQERVEYICKWRTRQKKKVPPCRAGRCTEWPCSGPVRREGAAEPFGLRTSLSFAGVVVVGED